jgi:hypothetical protein
MVLRRLPARAQVVGFALLGERHVLLAGVLAEQVLVMRSIGSGFDEIARAISNALGMSPSCGMT